MDKRLETYLQTVESELGEMREARREAELREMRQHIEAIIARLTEGGLSQEEATEAAIAQFGEARQVGRELEKMGTGKESLMRTVAAPLGGALCYVVLALAMFTIDGFVLRGTGATGVVDWWHGPMGTFLKIWPVALTSGAVSGLVSPRWGGKLLLSLASLLLVLIAVGTWFSSPITSQLFWSSHTLPAILLSHVSGILLGARWARRIEMRIEPVGSSKERHGDKRLNPV